MRYRVIRLKLFNTEIYHTKYFIHKFNICNLWYRLYVVDMMHVDNYGLITVSQIMQV